MKIFATLIFSFVLTTQTSYAADLLLKWTDQSNIEDGFYVHRAASNTGTYTRIGTVPPATAKSVVSFPDPDGKVGNCYRVTAFNGLGESKPSNTFCADVSTAPTGATVEVGALKVLSTGTVSIFASVTKTLDALSGGRAYGLGVYGWSGRSDC